jgi:Zn-finger nucleic acid-binding protein
MDCPRCSSPLGEMNNEGVTMDFCSGCKGIWFDAGEVGSYFELSRDLPMLSGASRQEQDSGISCPRCSSGMKQMLYAPPNDLTIDQCTSCGGMWFDKGEVRVLHKLSATLEDPKSRFAGVASALEARGYQVIGYKTD